MIHGVVRDETGTPISNAGVRASGEAVQTGAKGTTVTDTDSQGRFGLVIVLVENRTAATTVALNAARFGHSPGEYMFSVPAGAAPTSVDGIDLTLASLGTSLSAEETRTESASPSDPACESGSYSYYDDAPDFPNGCRLFRVDTIARGAIRVELIAPKSASLEMFMFDGQSWVMATGGLPNTRTLTVPSGRSVQIVVGSGDPAASVSVSFTLRTSPVGS